MESREVTTDSEHLDVVHTQPADPSEGNYIAVIYGAGTTTNRIKRSHIYTYFWDINLDFADRIKST